jgi:hypothetical protein
LAFIASNLDRPDEVTDDYQGQCGASNCMEPLATNLAIIFGTRLIVKNLTDLFIPWYNAINKRKTETAGVAEGNTLTPAEEDYVLMTYNSTIEGIANYADLAIQFGFAVLFVTALPIASFLSLASNYVKAKAVGWKLTKLYQRPIPLGAQDIGTWQAIFHIVSMTAVVTNAGLVCFTMDVLQHYDIYGRSWIFIGFQWTLISVQFIVAQVIPDEPEEAVIQLERQKFIVSKILDRTEDEETVKVADYQEWVRKSHQEVDENAQRPDFPIQPYPRAGGGLINNPMNH